MADQDAPRPGEPGAESEPYGDSPTGGAERRVTPGAPEPGTNQGRAEPVGEGNVSPGAGSYGSDAGGTGVGTMQPDRAANRVPAAGAQPVSSNAQPTGRPDAGSAPRQPQHYGSSPEPIGTDDVAGAGAATPGRVTDPEATTGQEADATYGLRREAMPGTSEAAAEAQGVRRAAEEPAGTGWAGTGSAGIEQPLNERRTGESGPGSAGATRGEALQPPVEQTLTGDEEPPPSHERPVTNVHRSSAPSGEVSP